MRILFVSTWFPVPVDNGARIRVFNLLRWLARSHEVTLLSLAPAGLAPETWRRELDFCAAVETFPERAFSPQQRSPLAAYLNGTPRSLLATFDPRLAARIAAHPCDVVVASQLRAAAHVPAGGAVPALFEELELGALYHRYTNAPNLSGRLRHALTWHKHRRYVAGLLRRFAASTVVSTVERDLVQAAAPRVPAPVVIPNGLDLSRYAGEHVPQPDTLVHAGALSYAPNRDAAEWFVRAILPGLRRRRPKLRLTLTGDPANRIFSADDGVEQTGWVRDVRPVIGRAWASIVPLRGGGGTRFKILESMALGTPVISTSKGVEGLDVVDGEQVLIADDAATFAAAVERLLDDPELRWRLAANGRRFVREHHDWDRIAPRLADLLQEIAARRGIPAPPV